MGKHWDPLSYEFLVGNKVNSKLILSLWLHPSAINVDRIISLTQEFFRPLLVLLLQLKDVF